MGSVTCPHPSGSYGPVTASGYAILPANFKSTFVMMLKCNPKGGSTLQSSHFIINKMSSFQLASTNYMDPGTSSGSVRTRY